FIPQLEKTALINRLSWWVINKAAEEKLYLQKQGIDINMAVNITPHNLQGNDFISNISSILNKYNISSSQFELELTETEIMEELKEGKKLINLLLKKGYKVAMDDFGTGYSSFAYLKNLDFDIIKIDLSFVREMETDRRSYEIVKTAIKLGHVLDKEVVAEGIENKNIMQQLKELKCDLGQGYYISKPLFKKEFIEFYRNW
ncbi:MAG: EAL domain-containing protein, partial [Bacillota bacterium]